MHQINKDTGVLIQKQGKLLFNGYYFSGKTTFVSKDFSSMGEHNRRRKFLGCYFESSDCIAKPITQAFE